MKYFIVAVLCLSFSNYVLSYTYLGTNVRAYRVRSGRDYNEEDTRVQGVYTYVDKYGLTHYVTYIAGPYIGFKIVQDIIGTGEVYFQAESHEGHHVPSVNVEEVVKVHHLRNEVPANVHRTSIPDLVYSLAPPPLLRRS